MEQVGNHCTGPKPICVTVNLQRRLASHKQNDSRIVLSIVYRSRWSLMGNMHNQLLMYDAVQTLKMRDPDPPDGFYSSTCFFAIAALALFRFGTERYYTPEDHY